MTGLRKNKQTNKYRKKEKNEKKDLTKNEGRLAKR